jgi:formylglycine-generating enzyme required for sulfatase activity
MVKVAAFCMDRYEASLVEILSNRQTRVWSPYFNPGNTRVKAVSIKGAVPQGYINGVQAAKACKAAGKRLCTDAEWLRACRGTSNTVYPYGNSRKSRVCNDSRSLHPAVEYFNSSASWVFSKIQHQCLNQLPNGLARSGDYSGCVTKEGVHDLMGNLHEWTSNSTGVFRGGYYVDTYRNGNGCLYRTTAHNTLHWDYSTGFRCCADLPRP